MQFGSLLINTFCKYFIILYICAELYLIRKFYMLNCTRNNIFVHSSHVPLLIHEGSRLRPQSTEPNNEIHQNSPLSPKTDVCTACLFDILNHYFFFWTKKREKKLTEKPQNNQQQKQSTHETASTMHYPRNTVGKKKRKYRSLTCHTVPGLSFLSQKATCFFF